MGSDTAVIREGTQSDSFVVPSTRLGGFLAVRKLGQGGAGTVFLALTPDRKRRVALKVLPPQASQSERLRLLREARVAKRLDHKNIVRVYGVKESHGLAFLVMQLVNGCSLQDRVREGPLEAEEAVYLAERLARALHYAHQEGVLHRDLKPSNILLKRSGEPMLTDFGLAKDRKEKHSQLTVEGDLLGTPSFMPPEQALGEIDRMDERADVYGLGATLYSMLTGAPPFVGKWLKVLTEVVHEQPVPPSAKIRVDPELEQICLRCLEKKPKDRYPSMLALAEALASCARRLRGATPSLQDLDRLSEERTIVMSRREEKKEQLLPKRRRRTRSERALRPVGSERIIALTSSENEALRLVGEPEPELRLIGDTPSPDVDGADLAPARQRRKRRSRTSRASRARSTTVRGTGSRSGTRRVRRNSQNPVVALSIVLGAFLVAGLGLAVLGGGSNQADLAEADEDITPAARAPEGGPLVSDIAAREEQPSTPQADAPAVDVPAPEPVPAEPPAVEERIEEPTVAPPARDEPAPNPEAKTPTTTRSPAPRSLAVVRRGEVTLSTRTFSVGDALPMDAALRAGSRTVEIESDGVVSAFLSARTRFSLRGDEAKPTLRIERGSLFARSLGKRPYVVDTPDGVAVPVGTEFLVCVSAEKRTRVATYDGEVRVGKRGETPLLAVRAGFEVQVRRGRTEWLPNAIRKATSAVRFVPPSARPTVPKLPRVLSSFTFDDGQPAGFSGTLQAHGAIGSKGCLRGAPHEKEDDGRSVVRKEADDVLPLASDIWIEALVKTDRKTKITFEVYDQEKDSSVRIKVPIEANTWTPIAVPVKDLRSSSGSKSALGLDGPCRRLEIMAGDCKDEERPQLLVDNIRFISR